MPISLSGSCCQYFDLEDTILRLVSAIEINFSYIIDRLMRMRFQNYTEREGVANHFHSLETLLRNVSLIIYNNLSATGQTIPMKQIKSKSVSESMKQIKSK